LIANNVFYYVYGTLQCPPATIGTGDAAVKNPTFIV